MQALWLAGMITLDFDGPLALIRLDRPAARNALPRAGWQALAEAIAQVQASDARVLILGSAHGAAFCAGSDLSEIGALADHPKQRAEFRRLMRAAMDPLRALAIPALAVIEGDCFGAGVALALACDIRVAGTRARFAVTPAKLGLSYPQQDVARLVEAVGRGQAARLLFAGEAVDAGEAARIGLVELAVDDAWAEGHRLARLCAGNAPGSLAALKAVLDAGPGDAGDTLFDACFDHPDFRARVAAFHARPRAGRTG